MARGEAAEAALRAERDERRDERSALEKRLDELNATNDDLHAAETARRDEVGVCVFARSRWCGLVGVAEPPCLARGPRRHSCRAWLARWMLRVSSSLSRRLVWLGILRATPTSHF